VYRNDRPVVLLNLFFSQSEVCDELDIEPFFNQYELPFAAVDFLMA